MVYIAAFYVARNKTVSVRYIITYIKWIYKNNRFLPFKIILSYTTKKISPLQKWNYKRLKIRKYYTLEYNMYIHIYIYIFEVIKHYFVMASHCQLTSPKGENNQSANALRMSTVHSLCIRSCISSCPVCFQRKCLICY